MGEWFRFIKRFYNWATDYILERVKRLDREIRGGSEKPKG